MRDPSELPAFPPAVASEGRAAEEDKWIVDVVVESPAGATSKIEWGPELGAFTLSRPLPLGLAYPHDWGFVPRNAGGGR